MSSREKPRGFEIKATFRDGLSSGVLFNRSYHGFVPHEIDNPIDDQRIGEELGSVAKCLGIPRTDLVLAHAALTLAGNDGTMPGSRLEPFFKAAQQIVAYWRKHDELRDKDPDAFAKKYSENSDC